MSVIDDDDDEMPKTPCLGCGKWMTDYDGFVVVAHLYPEQVAPEHRARVEFDAEPCGFCRHLSRDRVAGTDWWRCGFCGHMRRDDGAEIASFIRFTGDTRCEFHTTEQKCIARAEVVLVTASGARIPPMDVGTPAWGFGVLCRAHGAQVVECQRALGVEWHMIAAVVRP